MPTSTVDMTGEWISLGAGKRVFSAVESGSGFWQTQAPGASALDLSAQTGHPISAGEVVIYDAGTEEIFLKGAASVKFSVTV